MDDDALKESKDDIDLETRSCRNKSTGIDGTGSGWEACEDRSIKYKGNRIVISTMRDVHECVPRRVTEPSIADAVTLANAQEMRRSSG